MYYYTGPQGTDDPKGPYDLEQLRDLRDAGAITDRHLVAKDGDSAWKPLKEVLPQSMVRIRHVPYSTSATVTPAAPKKRLRWAIIAGVCLVLVGIKAFSWSAHRSADFEKEAVDELYRVQASLAHGDFDDAISRGNALADTLHDRGEYDKESDVRRLLSQVAGTKYNKSTPTPTASSSSAEDDRRALAVLAALDTLARQAPAPQTTDRFRELNRSSGTVSHSCQQCSGHGTITTPSGYVTTCPLCGGTGWTKSAEGLNRHYDPLAGY